MDEVDLVRFLQRPAERSNPRLDVRRIELCPCPQESSRATRPQTYPSRSPPNPSPRSNHKRAGCLDESAPASASPPVAGHSLRSCREERRPGENGATRLFPALRPARTKSQMSAGPGSRFFNTIASGEFFPLSEIRGRGSGGGWQSRAETIVGSRARNIWRGYAQADGRPLRVY